MYRQTARTSFCFSLLAVLAAQLCTGTFARAQSFYELAWRHTYNMSVGSETEDNWVANSFKARSGTHLVSVSFPIAADFTNQPVSVFMYAGFDLQDPTAGGGLVLLGQTNTTFTATVGDIVTIPLNTPIDVNTGDIFYAAVMIPGVPGGNSGKFPFYVAIQDAALGTTPLGQSFFDVGPGDPGSGQGGTFDITTQVIANITPFGSVHPVLGGGPTDVVDPGNLALFVKGTLP